MANGKREEKSTLSKIADSVKDFFGGIRNDISNTINYNDLPSKTAARHRAKTNATVKANKARNAASGESNNSSPAQSNRNIAARRAATNIAPVAAAPSVPDPNAIGETEQALLDAQKTGRSSTIATSASGLLSDEDSTRKKRSLMSGLLT
tara:strand:+ start:185 stop:634 length:450 start_codon:yes stop_codon:yes gene_type:complete